MRILLLYICLLFIVIFNLAAYLPKMLNSENTKHVISLILNEPEMKNLMNYGTNGIQADIRFYDKSKTFTETEWSIKVPAVNDSSVIVYLMDWKRVGYDLNGSMYRDVLIDSYEKISKRKYRLVLNVRPFRLDLRDSNYAILIFEVEIDEGEPTVKLVEAMSSE